MSVSYFPYSNAHWHHQQPQDITPWEQKQTKIAQFAPISVILLPGVGKQRWVLSAVPYSFSGTPVNGRIVITWSDGGVSYTETHYVTTGGQDELTWPVPRPFPVGSGLSITLWEDSKAVTGSIYPQVQLH